MGLELIQLPTHWLATFEGMNGQPILSIHKIVLGINDRIVELCGRKSCDRKVLNRQIQFLPVFTASHGSECVSDKLACDSGSLAAAS